MGKKRIAILGGGVLWGVQSGWLQRQWDTAAEVALESTAEAGLSLQIVGL